jgi:hypothetical protein
METAKITDVAVIKIPMQFTESLYLTSESFCCAVSAHKVIGPAFFEEIRSNHNVKLILTPLFRELTGEEKTGQSTFFARIEGQFLKRNC